MRALGHQVIAARKGEACSAPLNILQGWPRPPDDGPKPVRDRWRSPDWPGRRAPRPPASTRDARSPRGRRPRAPSESAGYRSSNGSSVGGQRASTRSSNGWKQSGSNTTRGSLDMRITLREPRRPRVRCSSERIHGSFRPSPGAARGVADDGCSAWATSSDAHAAALTASPPGFGSSTEEIHEDEWRPVWTWSSRLRRSGCRRRTSGSTRDQ
jgi:hypothetical protein